MHNMTSIPADWQPPELAGPLMHGDMPGDRIHVGPAHIKKADVLFPPLMRRLSHIPAERAVVAVSGGSGVGKSEIASVLGEYLESAGLGCYILSGDNYPLRIPRLNDAERLNVFRNAGLRRLAQADVRKDVFDRLLSLQRAGLDADAGEAESLPWLAEYQKAGAAALGDYLGSPAELDFFGLSDIICQFKNGGGSIWLKRMGREEAQTWYDRQSFSDTRVLLIEWTHSNSPYLEGVDISIYLHSTPQETLRHRLARARDRGADSPFTSMVLALEQRQLLSQAGRADLILNMQAQLMRFSDLQAEGGRI